MAKAKPTSIDRKILTNRAKGYRWDYGRKLNVPVDGWQRARDRCIAFEWLRMSESGRLEITDEGRAALQ